MCYEVVWPIGVVLKWFVVVWCVLGWFWGVSTVPLYTSRWKLKCLGVTISTTPSLGDLKILLNVKPRISILECS